MNYNSDTIVKMYSPIWSKYRPAILKMLIESAAEPQRYQLSAHEFKALNSKQRGGYHFILQVSEGKAQNNIKESIVAQDLLETLRSSPKGSELIQGGSYEISMDKLFVLHVSKLN
ncbi:hypothetical protein [Chryseosolibacter indicus]|uniref:Uncharacterized protein n=1 Tax=Chryseosolibacter indicus TaxID=2782351 RepID=A0ABS5VMZ4_9BACT|nr:hypothetical protein [Chryseosolibacter indicus]MBT1702825.1 hypothetical protein [Chryseosolibacter indicus]